MFITTKFFKKIYDKNYKELKNLEFFVSPKRGAFEKDHNCFVFEKFIGEPLIYSQVDVIPRLLFFYCDILFWNLIKLY